MQHPVIVAISGASGTIYGIELLKALKNLEVPSILVMSPEAILTLKYECKITLKEVQQLATINLHHNNIAASVASGGLKTRGMVIAPCSVKTLSAVANCYSDNLINRAADVTLKERRKLIIMFRETPLHLGHIKLMEQATMSGAIIMPPMPTFYNLPTSIEDIIHSVVGKVLDLLEIDNNLYTRWKEAEPTL